MTDHAPLVLDIAGTELTATDRARLAHPLTGGMILFARNWRDRGSSPACAPTSRPCGTTC
jgi:beta-N-acetylhexosaminidase